MTLAPERRPGRAAIHAVPPATLPGKRPVVRILPGVNLNEAFTAVPGA